MKKGFILALLMVAMVAMVLPVSARAPIVGPLPTIIIGDADDAETSGSVQYGILRAPDILDLMEKIDWNNAPDVYTSDLYHAYLLNPDEGTPPSILPYDATGIIDLLTTEEYDNIIVSGTAPAATARIPLPSLSLFDATHHPAIVDPATADPTDDGEVLSTYTAETTLIFLAAVEATDSPVLAAADLGTTSTADSVSPITVKCQSGGNDATESPITVVVSYTFEGDTEGWLFKTLAGYAVPAAIGGVGETGVGFRLAAPASALTHAYWQSPQDISGSSEQAGRVYRALAKLTSTAGSSDTCSGWRLTCRNRGFSHVSKVTMETSGAQPAGEQNAPASGDSAPYETRLYWVAPYFLGDMGDTEGQALTPDPAGDYREYAVTFDQIANGGSTPDTGDLVMEEIEISYILRPIDVTPEIVWGTGGTAFNAALGAGQWKQGASLASLGFADGTINIAAANITMNIGGTSGNRYVAATSQDYSLTSPYPPVNQLQPVSNHLYRFSYAVSCASRSTVPTYRCSINGLYQVPLSLPANRKMNWAEYNAYSNLTMIGKLPAYIWPGQSAAVCPGAPSASAGAPTRLESYVWSHSVAPQTGSLISTIFPVLSLADVGNFDGVETSSLWADPHGNLLFSAAQWEDLGSDY